MLFPNQRFIFTDELEYNMAWFPVVKNKKININASVIQVNAQGGLIQGYQITLNFWDTTVLNARTKATNTKNQ